MIDTTVELGINVSYIFILNGKYEILDGHRLVNKIPQRKNVFSSHACILLSQKVAA